jgi:exodeoxyribonuclease VII small subunit
VTEADRDIDPAELGFNGALAELERIVTELESDDLDVDHLAQRVERAARLVAWCRERIEGTRFQVDEILDRLDGGVDGAPPDER